MFLNLWLPSAQTGSSCVPCLILIDTNCCKRISWLVSAVHRWLLPVFQRCLVSNIFHLNSSHSHRQTLTLQLGSKCSVLLRSWKLIFLPTLFNDCWLSDPSLRFLTAYVVLPTLVNTVPPSSPPFLCTGGCSQVLVVLWNKVQVSVLPDTLVFFEALVKCCAVAHHHQQLLPSTTRWCSCPKGFFHHRTSPCFLSLSVLSSLVFWQLRLAD